jgi:hypothetical protein
MMTSSAPAATLVREVLAWDEPVVRNLKITQCYHDLSDRMSRLLGGENATWCTFGCWASRTAGSFIRGEDVPRILRSRLADPASLGHQVTRVVSALPISAAVRRPPLDIIVDTAAALASDVSLFIMQGNRVVFEEMAGAFERFVEVMSAGVATEDALNELLSEYRVGPPQPDVVTLDRAARTVTSWQVGGQSVLRQMLQHYYLAMRERDGARRAQLVLLANTLGGIHEQTRLQTYIVRSIDAPLDDLVRDALHRAAVEGRSSYPQRHETHAMVDGLAHPLIAAVKDAWQQVVTTALMTMRLPDVILHLGRDVPSAPGQPLFPSQLATIELPALGQLLEQYQKGDQRRGNGVLGTIERDVVSLVEHASGHLAVSGSAALDWTRLPQRMRYILELFRSRQQDAMLFSEPFDATQRAAISAGVLPEGSL